MDECKHGGLTLDNGNCTIPASDDELPVQCVGNWVPDDKHHYLKRYIEATRAVRAKFLVPSQGRPAGGAAFIDLFAGPGKCRVRETGEIIPGSPMLALMHEGAPFTKVIACDIDDENVSSLSLRTAGYRGRSLILKGDCNEIIDDVVRAVPPFGLNIALIDPFGLDALKFETIRKLAAVRRMDLIIHFPTMDMKRNFDRNQDSVRTFVGAEAGKTLVTAPRDVPGMIQQLRSNLEPLGYTGDQVRSMAVKNSRKATLYHLVFVSKDARGNAIWQSITKTDSRGQRSLF